MAKEDIQKRTTLCLLRMEARFKRCHISLEICIPPPLPPWFDLGWKYAGIREYNRRAVFTNAMYVTIATGLARLKKGVFVCTDIFSLLISSLSFFFYRHETRFFFFFLLSIWIFIYYANEKELSAKKEKIYMGHGADIGCNLTCQPLLTCEILRCPHCGFVN